jgi:hypothetical protein
MMPLLICACSNRKTPPASVRAVRLPTGSFETVGTHWLDAIKRQPRYPALSLYGGRSVREAERAAETLGARLVFASAGLGWVSGNELIPSYGMTVVAGEDSVLGRLAGGASPAQWWSWISTRSPYSKDVGELAANDQGLILVALPRSYLEMVADDLAGLAELVGGRLRIIGRANDAADERLTPWTVHYDERLNGAGSDRAGTQTDFATRAARHFVEAILPGREAQNIDAHRRAVEEALAQWKQAPRVARRRVADVELAALIRRELQTRTSRAKSMIRILRDDLGVACEQDRCKRITDAVLAEIGGGRQ